MTDVESTVMDAMTTEYKTAGGSSIKMAFNGLN